MINKLAHLLSHGVFLAYDVLRGRPATVHRHLVSFCWDGPVEKLDERYFAAHAKNFTPHRELHIASL
jgi:hypothetical protein